MNIITIDPEFYHPYFLSDLGQHYACDRSI